jgi:hypothetical protein
MTQNEPVDNALQDIDKYVIEVSRSTEAPRPQSDGQPISPSQRTLGQHKVGTFIPLLDFQNARSVQSAATPLMPNEF